MTLTRYRPTTFTIPSFGIATPTSGRLDEEFVDQAASAFQSFPPEAALALADLMAGHERAGAVLLRGMPVGQLAETPATPSAATSKDATSELVLLAVARHLGEPVGYAPEHGGQIVQNIVPVRASADRQVSTSSKVTLEFHTETAFHPYKPHYLLLLCLRGDPSAATTLCSVSAALDLLDTDTITALRQPQFRTRPDASFLEDARFVGEYGPDIAILSGPSERPTLTYDADLMIGTNEAAQSALEALRLAVHAAQEAVFLESGDLLVIDNHAAVHGRSPFTPRYDGRDRWLQRTFVVDHLCPEGPDRTGRVITTTFR